MSLRPELIVKPAKLLRTDFIGCIDLVIDPTSAVLPMPQAFAPQVQFCRASRLRMPGEKHCVSGSFMVKVAN
jgi:hypothetical protein